MESDKNSVQEVKINDTVFEITKFKANNELDPPDIRRNVCFSYSGCIYTYSGIDNSGNSNSLFKRKISKSGEVYGEWEKMEQKGNIPIPRFNAIGLVIDNYFYLFGGFTDDDEGVTPKMWKMKITTCEWVNVILKDSNGNIIRIPTRDHYLMFCDSLRKQIFIHTKDDGNVYIYKEIFQLSFNSINNEIIVEKLEFKLIGDKITYFGNPLQCLLFPYNSNQQLAFILCCGTVFGILRNFIICLDIKNKSIYTVEKKTNGIKDFLIRNNSCFHISKNESLIFSGYESEADVILFELIEMEKKQIIKLKNLGQISNMSGKSNAGIYSNVEESFCFMFGGIHYKDQISYRTNDLILIKKKETSNVILFKKKLKENSSFCDCTIRFKDYCDDY
jgi:hypothetical protein